MKDTLQTLYFIEETLQAPIKINTTETTTTLVIVKLSKTKGKGKKSYKQLEGKRHTIFKRATIILTNL